MKKLVFCFLLLPFMGFSQLLLGGKNIVKVNLTSLALTNFNATYERSLTKKISFSLSYRYMPKSNLPVKDLVKQYVYDDPNLSLDEFKLGNNAITPELRIYAGMGRMKGFYIAFYGRFASFDFTVPIKYQSTVGTKTADFNGIVKSTSGGVMLGIQRNIAKKLVLDFWLLGGHYGTSSGDLLASNFNGNNSALTPYEKYSLENTINTMDFTPFKVKCNVATDNKSATVTSDGPWAGVRALGLSLGIRF